jgi:hypothetical protein
MAKTREWLPKILVESFLIAFSVLLALGVDDWKEERENQQLVRKALANFEREIRQNKAHIESRLGYHEKLHESLEGVDPKDVHTFEELRQKVDFRGLNPAFLVDTAWQTALTTNALSYMEYDTVSRLSEIYTLQQRLYDYNGSMTVTFLPLLSDKNVSTLILPLVSYQSDVVGIEKNLLRQYGAVLEHLRTLSTGYTPATSDSRSAPRSSPPRPSGGAS